MVLDSYATTTDMFYALHQDITTSGATLSEIQYALTEAKRVMKGYFKTAWTTSSPPDEVAAVCLRIAVRGWSWGEQMRLNRGAASHTDAAISFNFPGGNPFYVSKDDAQMIVGSATKGRAYKVGGAYVSTP